MNYHITLLTVLLCLFMISCGTDSDTEGWTGSWQELHLQDLEVHTIAHSDKNLFVGTDEGAFKLNVNVIDEWQAIGLESDSTKVMDFVLWDSQNLVASVNYDTIRQEDKVLFKTSNGGETWEGWSLNIPEVTINHSYIYYLDYSKKAHQCCMVMQVIFSNQKIKARIGKGCFQLISQNSYM